MAWATLAAISCGCGRGRVVTGHRVVAQMPVAKDATREELLEAYNLIARSTTCGNSRDRAGAGDRNHGFRHGQRRRDVSGFDSLQEKIPRWTGGHRTGQQQAHGEFAAAAPAGC